MDYSTGKSDQVVSKTRVDFSAGGEGRGGPGPRALRTVVPLHLGRGQIKLKV